MDDWNQKQHGTSGLAAAPFAPARPPKRKRKARTLEFLAPLVKPGA